MTERAPRQDLGLAHVTDGQSGGRDGLRQLVAQTLNVPYQQVDESSTPDSLSAWDSVGHLSLVIAIEKHYAIQLAPEAIAEMNSIGEIRQLLHHRCGEEVEPCRER